MKNITPVKAIRKKCLDCAERPKDVRHCPSEDCSLFPFRLGKNPNRSGKGGFSKKSDIQMKAPESETDKPMQDKGEVGEMQKTSLE